MRNFSPLVAASILALCAVAPASAGTIAIAWDPVSASSLAGYRIYYGTSTRNYTGQQDVGLVTAATLSGLANCSNYYVALKARDADGDLSASFSAEISGFPRPILTSVVPSTAERGARTNLVISGANFASGASVRFTDSSITVHSVTVSSCTQLTADVTIGASAATGSPGIEVSNADRVFGSGGGLLAVVAAVAPGVATVAPASLADDVSVAVRPTVVFSRVMLPATITTATIALLDASGSEVAQSAGSPSLSTDGKTATIVPADDLGYENSYRIRVRGGASGVRSAAGSSMASDFLQSPGFTTQSSNPGYPRVLYTAPANTTIGVAVNTRPVVMFSEPMDRTTLTRANVALLDLLGNAVAQAAGSPVVSADNRTVTLVPADDLAHLSAYRIRVLGEDGGVRDLAGATMARTYLQTPGFTTALGVSVPPQVLSVTPPNGTALVQLGVHPSVVFSEPMQAATITPATVSLLDSAGYPVPQEIGSPQLSSDGTTATIIPAPPLLFASTYRVRVLAGATGARDASGDPLAQTFVQTVGFQTMTNQSDLPRVTGVAPSSLTTGVARDVRPLVYFSEPMDPASIRSSSVLLLDSSGRAVAQAGGSPDLSLDGMRVTIIPAASLAYGATYRVRVLGGTSGVTDSTDDLLPATYTQGAGFTTVPDEESPELTSISATPGATTAEVAWTTNERADSRVFYRREIDVVYQQPILDELLVTNHSLQITGLSPWTSYAFYVESTDSEGNRRTSPEGSFDTTASSYIYLTIEAESGRLTPPIRAFSGAGAFREFWIDTPQFTQTGRATAPSGKAELSFYVPVEGTWKVWARLFGVPGGAGSWFESIDGAGRRTFTTSTTGVWEWVPGRAYTLAPGLHVLELGGHEDQARVDRVVITNDPWFVASEQPAADTSPPTSPQDFTLTPGAGQTTLRWTILPNSDIGSVVLRYRTDGSYPASPADGIPVLARAASSATDDSYVHTGLANGTTYSYSLFAIDESGNISTPAQGQATPTP